MTKSVFPVSGDEPVLRSLTDSALDMSPWLLAGPEGFRFVPRQWPHSSRELLAGILGETDWPWPTPEAPPRFVHSSPVRILPAQAVQHFPLQALSRLLFQCEKTFRSRWNETLAKLDTTRASSPSGSHVPSRKEAQECLHWLETALGNALSAGLEAQVVTAPLLDSLLLPGKVIAPENVPAVRHRERWGASLVCQCHGAQIREGKPVRGILESLPWLDLARDACTVASSGDRSLLDGSPFPTRVSASVWPKGLATSFSDFEKRIGTVQGILIHALNRWEMANELEGHLTAFRKPRPEALAVALSAQARKDALASAEAFFELLGSTPFLILLATGVLQWAAGDGTPRVCLGQRVFRQLFARSTLGSPILQGAFPTEGNVGAAPIAPLPENTPLKDTLSLGEAFEIWRRLR